MVCVTSRDTPVTVYLTSDEKAKLDDWASETDKSLSHLCREAILEYTDRDRTERIEHEMRQVNDKLDRVLTLVDGEHTHTRGGDSRTQSVPEKTRTIARRVYENHEMPVKMTDVELAIEDIAGADDRTLGKYKEQLKKRGLLYEHPNSPVWTDDETEWVQWMENAHVRVDVHEVTQPYAMSTTEYTQLAEETVDAI